MDKLQWHAEKRKVKDLVHWEENPRKIDERDFEMLKSRIEQRGFHDVVKIDTRNIILSGNMRKDALEALGIEEVNVLVPSRELTTEEMIQVGLESNMQDGSWDTDKLQSLGMENLLKAGFGDEELSAMFDNVDTTEDGFNIAKAIEEAKTTEIKPGDIYELGEHRMMCGDSLNPEDVAKLMGGGQDIDDLLRPALQHRTRLQLGHRHHQEIPRLEVPGPPIQGRGF